MGGNMGTPPAPPQPQQVNFTTTAESRGGFNNFLKSIPSTLPPPMPPANAMPPMGGNPMGNIDIFNQPMGMMGMNQPQMNPMMQQPMQQPMMQQPMNMGIMQQPMMMADGGNVDKNDIGVKNFADKNGGIVDGLPRMWKSSLDQPMTYLSYITGEEQDFLRKSNIHEKEDPNRIGQPGPKGVPSFDDPGGDTEDEGSDYSEAPSDDNNDDNNDYSDFSSFSNNTDYSDPDSDMDYTDEDLGYTTISGPPGPDGPQSDMDRATQKGQEQAVANAANAANAANQQITQNIINSLVTNRNKEFSKNNAIDQADRQKSIDALENPMDAFNQMVDRSTSYSPPGSMPGGPPTSNVQAASIQGGNQLSGSDGSGIDFGINLGLGPDVTPSIASVSPTSVPGFASVTGTGGKDVTGFNTKGPTFSGDGKDTKDYGNIGAGRDVSDFTTADQVRAFDDMREKADKGYFPGLEKLPSYLGGIGGLINAGTKNIAKSVVNNFNRGFAPTYGKKGEDRQGNITGTSDYGIGMGMPSSDKNMEQGPFGNLFGTGETVPGYDVFDATSPSIGMYDTPADTSGNDGGNDDPLILLRKKLIEKEEEEDKTPNVFGGSTLDPVSSGPVVVDSPFTSNVGNFTPSTFSAGDLNALIAQLTGVASPKAMAQGGIAGYANGGGVDQALDRFLASA